MALVEIARFLSPFEAGLAKSVLDAEGIPAILFDSNSAFTPGLAWVEVRLMVHEDDLAEAQRLLAEVA